MAFPEDALKLPLSPSQLIEVAKTMRRRLPHDRELELAADPEALNDYSKAFFGGGELPELMHNWMLCHGFRSPCPEVVKDYCGRIQRSAP